MAMVNPNININIQQQKYITLQEKVHISIPKSVYYRKMQILTHL